MLPASLRQAMWMLTVQVQSLRSLPMTVGEANRTRETAFGICNEEGKSRWAPDYMFFWQHLLDGADKHASGKARTAHASFLSRRSSIALQFAKLRPNLLPESSS